MSRRRASETWVVDCKAASNNQPDNEFPRQLCDRDGQGYSNSLLALLPNLAAGLIHDNKFPMEERRW